MDSKFHDNGVSDEFVELNKQFQLGIISAREFKERWEALIQKVYVEDYDTRLNSFKRRFYDQGKNQI
jgi:hypothetical protein